MLTPREDGYQDLLDLCVKNNFELTELNQWTDFAVLRSLLPVDQDSGLRLPTQHGESQ